jgi:hypothetical protein
VYSSTRGALIGAVGTTIVFIGFGVCHFRERYRRVKLDQQVY